jgi:hypothetical protein
VGHLQGDRAGDAPDDQVTGRVRPPTGREGAPPLAFVSADTTAAKAVDTVAVLEEAGRRYWAPRRYDTHHRGVTSRDYGQAVSVVVTTLEQLRERGADAVVWRRLGYDGAQTPAPAGRLEGRNDARRFSTLAVRRWSP